MFRVRLVNQIKNFMGPDELLDGVGAGAKLQAGAAPIALPDKLRKGPKQQTLHRYFKIQAKKKPMLKQMTLYRFWVKAT